MAGKINGLMRCRCLSMLNNQFDKNYYSTGGYDDYLSRFALDSEKDVKKILRFAKLKQGTKTLDVGCGMGGLIMALRKRGFESFGTEVSDYCLNASPMKEYMVKTEVTKLPFEDDRFELVTCQDMLCYLNRRQLEGAVGEMTRVTSKYLFIEVIAKGSVNSKQSVNPDSLRKEENLLSETDWLKLLAKQQLKPVGRVFRRDENADFNYLWIKKRN